MRTHPPSVWIPVALSSAKTIFVAVRELVGLDATWNLQLGTHSGILRRQRIYKDIGRRVGWNTNKIDSDIKHMSSNPNAWNLTDERKRWPDIHCTADRLLPILRGGLLFLLEMPHELLDERFAVESLFDIIRLARTAGKYIVTIGRNLRRQAGHFEPSSTMVLTKGEF
jgi:hypothetical protein